MAGTALDPTLTTRRPLPGVAFPPVRVEALRKTYSGGVEALRGISFDVADGEIFGLLGPNGAGKTTTLGILTTTVRPSAGAAFVAGHDVVSSPLGVRRAIGVGFQDSVLDNEFTGRENLLLHARLWRMPERTARERIDALLEIIGLTQRADDNVRTYSGGTRRRLELARALLASPRVVFLDEPTVGLDPAVRDELWTLIRRLRREEGVTIVLSTHYLEEAEDVCDRVAIINHGMLTAIGEPAALVRSLGTELVEMRTTGDTAALARQLVDARLSSRPPLVRHDTVSLPSSLDPGELSARMSIFQRDGVGVVSSTLRRTTLADVFAHLTGAPFATDER